MQAADDVEFRGAFRDAFACALPHFIQSECVGAGRIGGASKGAELAMRHADIGGIDVAIDVEIGDVAVAFFADVIREPAYSEKIVRFIEREAIGGVKALAGENLFCDGLKPRVLERGSGCWAEL